MNPKLLVYIAGGIGALALLVGGWLLFGGLSSPNTADTGSQNALQKLIFGESSAPGGTIDDSLLYDDEESGEAVRLNQLVKEPVSGFLIYKNASNTEAVVYMERGSGFVHSLSLDTDERVRLSNTTLPRAVEAMFLSTTSVAVRYESEERAETLLGTIRSRGGNEGTLTGSLLPPDLTSISADPVSQSIFYLREVNRTARGFLLRPGKQAQEVFSSPLREWNASFLSRDKVLLVSKPAASAPGRAVLLDLAKGTERTILSGIYGLSVLGTPAGDKIVYSSGGSLFESSLFDIAKATTSALTLDTLSDKCAWGLAGTLYCGIPLAPNTGSYPDDWYMGKAHFSDDLWKIDTATGEYTLLSSPRKEVGQGIDIISLQVSPTGRYLVFMDQKDLSLWVYRVAP